MKDRVDDLLGKKSTRNLLLGLYLLMMIAGFAVFGDTPSGDQATYVGLANGLREGTFSYWTDVFEPPPIETYRTHGYPVFLWLVLSIFNDLSAVAVVQNLLLLLTLLLLLKWIGKGNDGIKRQNILLLLLLPQFQLLHYTHQVLPEALMVPLCTAVALTGMGTPSVQRSLILGLLIALAWWVRPVLLLFPLFVLLADLFLTKGAERLRNLRAHALTLSLFIVAAPLPFALWNLHVHGALKPIPISGSAVISNLGFWQHRLPGYGSMHYFHYNYFGWEFIPWVDQDQAATHYASYNEQWDRIETAAEPFMTEADRKNIPIMEAQHIEQFITRSPELTLALDSLIAKETLSAIKNEPGYYFTTRLYTAVRLWITNMNRPMERRVFQPETDFRPKASWPSSLKGWLSMIAPFVISLIFFGIGGSFLIVRVVRHPASWINERYAILLILYLWGIHVPMVIQSRYMVPVHAITLALITLAIVAKDRSHTIDAPRQNTEL